MSGWYVSYRAGGATVMSLAKSRDEAISAACGLLDRKINVQEIGRLLGMRDPDEIIDSVEIRKLHAMRPQPDSAHSGSTSCEVAAPRAETHTIRLPREKVG